VAEVSIAEAAASLGVSVDTIRRRIKRGELVAELDGKGRYVVRLGEPEAPRSVAELEAENKRLADLLDELRRQRDMLQQQVDDLRQYRQDDAEAQQQLRGLILALTSKVPQLPDPQEKRGWWIFKR
jgi:excisionase family DNA binding protein